jgi:sugar/nucleoside kinase (ribokinase family)
VPSPTYDVVALGNALVDVIAHAPDDFLPANGLVKGSMALIDEARADELYAAMGPAIESSGGSAGNTVAGLASLGSKVAFIGKVRDDVLGDVFRHDLHAAGVTFASPSATGGPATGRCLVIVTEDAERTMSTYLGAGADIAPDFIDPTVVGDAQVVYLEGYLWDQPEAKEAFRKASRVAHDHGRIVALTLSDSFCVERHRADFLDLLPASIDIVFGNEDEVKALYECGIDEAITRLREDVDIAVITRGAAGATIAGPDGMHDVPAAPVEKVVDTTGAGDLYAAGFLHGFTHGADLPECGRLGSIAAAEVISHVGPRPLVRLADLL